MTSGRRLVGYHLSRWATLAPHDWALNGASRGVSLGLGYREAGLKTVRNGGRLYEVERFRLEQDQWDKTALPWPVATVGADPLRRLFAIAR